MVLSLEGSVWGVRGVQLKHLTADRPEDASDCTTGVEGAAAQLVGCCCTCCLSLQRNTCSSAINCMCSEKAELSSPKAPIDLEQMSSRHGQQSCLGNKDSKMG
jgi:hypothetical protein